MKTVTTIGLDLAKSVLQVHGVDEEGVVVIRRALRRSQVLDFFRRLSPCLVGLEACSSSHYWAREIGACGHQVRMIPPIYVKAYVKRGKTDTADAEAICEAVTRPTMRFVPIKDVEQQAAGMLLRTRDLLVRQRSQLANSFRAQMSELGIISALGMASIAKLADKVRDPDVPLPPVAQLALLEMAEQIDVLTARIERLGQEIQASVKDDETARRLTSIPGVGPLIAAAVRATVNDIEGFRPAATSPPGWALRRACSPAAAKRSSDRSPNREPPAQGPAGRRRLVDHQAGQTRRLLTSVAYGADGPQALQTGRSSACEQDRSDHLGPPNQGRLLQEAGGRSGVGLTDREFSASSAETGAKAQMEGKSRRVRARYRIRRLTQWVLEPAKLIRRPHIAELIMASGHMPASIGRTYDCTASAGSDLHKRLACWAVPHMRQSQSSTPIDSAIRMGVPSDVARASRQRLGRAWSLAFHQHPSAPDGIVYPSRLNGQTNLAIYDRATPKLRVAIVGPLIAAPDLPTVLDELMVALV